MAYIQKFETLISKFSKAISAAAATNLQLTAIVGCR
jgi:hypothetical protein